MTTDSQTANALARAIKYCGKNQREIAEEIGFPKPNIISMMKKGDTKIPIERIPALAKACLVDPKHLLKLAMQEYHPEIWKVLVDAFGKPNNDWDFTRQLGELLSEHANLRQHVYSLLRDSATSPGLKMLAEAVAQNPDEDGVLLLVKLEQEGRVLHSWLTIEKIVTEHVPVDDYENTYNIVPLPAPDLRRKLLAMSTEWWAEGHRDELAQSNRHSPR